jgi:hypothetical protein
VSSSGSNHGLRNRARSSLFRPRVRGQVIDRRRGAVSICPSGFVDRSWDAASAESCVSNRNGAPGFNKCFLQAHMSQMGQKLKSNRPVPSSALTSSGHHVPGLRSSESANSGLVRRSEERLHSITSSAVASGDGGAILILTLTIRNQDIKARTQPLGAVSTVQLRCLHLQGITGSPGSVQSWC